MGFVLWTVSSECSTLLVVNTCQCHIKKIWLLLLYNSDRSQREQSFHSRAHCLTNFTNVGHCTQQSRKRQFWWAWSPASDEPSTCRSTSRRLQFASWDQARSFDPCKREMWTPTSEETRVLPGSAINVGQLRSSEFTHRRADFCWELCWKGFGNVWIGCWVDHSLLLWKETTSGEQVFPLQKCMPWSIHCVQLESRDEANQYSGTGELPSVQTVVWAFGGWPWENYFWNQK